jgi:hypothetical protein
MNVVLANTGALAALHDRCERYHSWTVEQIGTIRPPLVTCEAVRANSRIC